MKNISDWYDYENQSAISLPPVGVECEVNHRGDWHKTYIIGITKNNAAIYDCDEFDDRFVFDGNSKVNIFRPLDWNKNQVKTVSLDWLVGSGIDCEFICDELTKIAWLIKIDDGKHIYYDDHNRDWKQCRPRENHPMVLTDEQVNLIPEGFDYELYAVNDREWVSLFLVEKGLNNIVTFKGLKGGWKYP